MAKTKTIRPKPVQPSEITDPRIAREAIAEVHRKPTAKDIAYMEETREIFRRAMAR
jgi:hypothetical protein